MSKLLASLITALAFAAATPAAHAGLVEYDFTGNVVAGPASSPLNLYVQANNHISGYFLFDAATAPTSPGHWDLSSAIFHVKFDTLTLDTVGATAQVSALGDLISFVADVPPAEFPFPVTSSKLAMSFQTFTDGFFSLTTLPDFIPPNDHMMGLSVTGPWGTDGASTDTEFFLTVRTSVPEPASIAVVLAGLFGWRMMRRRASAGS